MVAVSGYLALFKPLRGRKPADELCGQVLRYLANEPQPQKLSTIHLVRGPADLSPRMPPICHGLPDRRLAAMISDVE